MPDGIFDEVGEHLGQQFAVAGDPVMAAGGGRDRQRFAVVLGDIGIDLADRRYHAGEINLR